MQWKREWLFVGELRNLIRCATANGVTFIYAISPGLDISYTSTKDLQALKNKLSQVGCEVKN